VTTSECSQSAGKATLAEERGILRDLTPGELARLEGKVRPAWRHAEAGRNVRPPRRDVVEQQQ
jgi:hypothetical protein